MISGLLSQKPSSPPLVVGQVKLFTWQSMIGKSGNPYVKIKNSTAENGGQPCAILKVTPTGHTDSYGNISFNVEIEPQQGAEQSAPISTPLRNGNYNGGLDERQRAIIRQHSQSMALELLKLKQTLGELTVLDLSPAKLRQLADYFDNDVTKTPQPHRPVGIDERSSEDWPVPNDMES